MLSTQLDECAQMYTLVQPSTQVRVKHTPVISESPHGLFLVILSQLVTYSDFYHDRLLLSIVELHLKWNT